MMKYILSLILFFSASVSQAYVCDRLDIMGGNRLIQSFMVDKINKFTYLKDDPASDVYTTLHIELVTGTTYDFAMRDITAIMYQGVSSNYLEIKCESDPHAPIVMLDCINNDHLMSPDKPLDWTADKPNGKPHFDVRPDPGYTHELEIVGQYTGNVYSDIDGFVFLDVKENNLLGIDAWAFYMPNEPVVIRTTSMELNTYLGCEFLGKYTGYEYTAANGLIDRDNIPPLNMELKANGTCHIKSDDKMNYDFVDVFEYKQGSNGFTHYVEPKADDEEGTDLELRDQPTYGVNGTFLVNDYIVISIHDYNQDRHENTRIYVTGKQPFTYVAGFCSGDAYKGVLELKNQETGELTHVWMDNYGYISKVATLTFKKGTSIGETCEALVAVDGQNIAKYTYTAGGIEPTITMQGKEAGHYLPQGSEAGTIYFDGFGTVEIDGKQYSYVMESGVATVDYNGQQRVFILDMGAMTYTELATEVTSVTLDKTTASLKAGETVALTATVNPSNATDKTVTWSSSDQTIATVSNGVVTAKNVGTATITAKAGSKTATCQITVVATEVTSVTLDKTTASLKAGETVTLNATVNPSDATDKTVTWSSSDQTIATVSNGVVTAKKVGTATTTAKAGSKTATCQVTVVATEVTSVTLDKTTASLKAGETVSLAATVNPSNATDKTVTWSSSDQTIATVSNGVVTAKKVGTATITAKAGSKTATCQVTVVATEVTSVTLDKTSASLKAGETVTLAATVNPSDATDKTVTWSSSDQTIATVSNGVVTANKVGTATITAKAGSKTATCQVTVVAKPQPTNEIWYTSSDGNIVIPYATDVFGANIVSNTYENGKGIIKFDAPITSVGDYAFKDCGSLKSVTIPNSVASIGTFTFNNCSSLTSIIIPNSVTEIGEQAFLSCSSLTSITIPNSITSIGIYTFKRCSSLTSVTIPDSVTEIADYAFACCSSLKAFYGKFASADNRCLIINGVLNSFAPAGLTEYVIPDSVTLIGGQAFLECSNLKSITIPNSVTSIREHAFRSSGLTNVTIPDKVTSIGERAFYMCNSLTSVTIGNSVISIGKDAFRECSSLTSATIGNSVTEIGVQAFFSCSSLTSVTIPDSATLIGDYAFKKCSGLISVTIGNSVTSIGKDAFHACSSLTNVYSKPTTPPAGCQYMFDQCASLRKIYVPYKAVDAYKSAEYWSRYASDIVGHDFETGEVVEIKPNNEIWYTSSDGNIVTPYATDVFGANIVSNTYENGKGIIKFDAPITSIGKNAFNNRTRLASVTIPNSVTWIGEYAFEDCYNLTSVTIPDSLTWIGGDAFRNCSSLTSVHISDVAAWCNIYFADPGSNPLGYAHNLYLNNRLVTDLIIPDSVTTIEQYAFYNCISLTSITIGKSVTEIGRAAFYCCRGKLIINSRRVVEGNYTEQLYYPSSEGGWLSGAMFTSITIGNDITSIGDYMFYNCSSLTSVTIGNSLSSIGYYAFRNCSSLKSVYISDIAAWCNISFGYYGNPLYYAHNLYLNNELVTNLTIPDSVTKIRRYAFISCSSLKTITIPNSVTLIGANAFENCGLKSVTIPDGVRDIGDYAFSRCGDLTSITISDGVTTIGDYAFADCGLKSVTIPDGVRTIGDQAFYRCIDLTSVTIGNGDIEVIGEEAFRGCSRLKKVFCKAVTPPSLGKSAFVENDSNLYIYVPEASVSTYKYTSGWSYYKSRIQGYNFK